MSTTVTPNVSLICLRRVPRSPKVVKDHSCFFKLKTSHRLASNRSPLNRNPSKVERMKSSPVFKKMHIWLLSQLTKPNCPMKILFMCFILHVSRVSTESGSWIFRIHRLWPFNSRLRWTDVFFFLWSFFSLGVVLRATAKTLSLMPTFYFYLLIFFHAADFGDWNKNNFSFEIVLWKDSLEMFRTTGHFYWFITDCFLCVRRYPVLRLCDHVTRDISTHFKKYRWSAFNDFQFHPQLRFTFDKIFFWLLKSFFFVWWLLKLHNLLIKR